MVPPHQPLDVLIMIGAATLLLLLGCCCIIRMMIMKCIAMHKRRKIAVAQEQPLIVNGDSSGNVHTDTMQKLLRTQSTRHLESRFAAEGKDILPEMDKMANVYIDAEGWMEMEVHQGLSPRSKKTFYFKFSHERHRMWYQEKETSLLCNGSVEMEQVQCIELKNDRNGIEQFGFTIHLISSDAFTFWCDSQQNRNRWVSVLQRCLMERIGLIESAEGQSNDEMAYSECTVTVTVTDDMEMKQDVVPVPYSGI